MDKKEILKYYFGYSSLKKEQENIVDSVLAGRDTIGLLPTGYGKSLTFQIPAMMLDGITIVVTPLIALMQDQVKNLKERFMPAEYINSLLSIEEMENVYLHIKQGKVKLLYVSGERLQSKRFLDVILKEDVSMIVCDEAHTLLWSEDFRHALGEIPSFIEKLKKRPKMLALTATATELTVEKITELLKLSNPVVITGDCDRKNIFYRVMKTKDKDRDLYFYIRNKKGIHGIIYCLTIKNVNHVYHFLKEKGFQVGMYHGAMDSLEKKNMQALYTSHALDIMVCTNAFGMGIDIPDIRYVVEYDLPSCIEDFMQQSGRCSRDGKPAESLLLFHLKDIETVEYFIDHIENENKSDKEIKKIKKDRYMKLDKMVNLCLTNVCLHKTVCEYFRVSHKGKCGMCSNCEKKKYIA